MERSIPCSQCRQRLIVKTRTKSTASTFCGSCTKVLPIPPNDEQTGQQQGFRSRIRSFGSQITSKVLHGQGTVTPSLNHDSASGIRSSKRAVLCGISYNDRKKYKLKGTINDVRNMREVLITRFRYPKECIRVLTEEETEQRYKPTRKNIEDSLRWLVNDCQSGDSLVFFYSGHGLRQHDFNQDETDGFDETICPVDFQNSGMILDNDLNSLIVCPLKPGVTLHAVVDTCHSGTMLDLPHLYFSLEKKWKDDTPPSGVDKPTSGGLAICISACLDNQAAADTSAFDGKMNGALTYLLTEVLKRLPSPTYGDLFDLIYETLDNMNQGCFVNTRILRRIFDYRLSQTPLLSSSDKFNVYEKHLFL
ncbi:hypothetical protein PTKIN_Ptkin02bG0152200 [Pterospermum kingtungense]